MSKSKESLRQQSSNQPEKKIGPFAHGIGCAIWLNRVETPKGIRQVRSITISPRRYLDATSGEWKDATSYRPADLAALIVALQRAQEFIVTTPIPGEEDEG